MKIKIQNLIKERNELLDSFDSVEIVSEAAIEMNERIDLLSDKINKLLNENYKNLPVDFTLESLTHLGQAPSLVYDDDGHWAISTDGYQSVSLSDEPIDMNTSFYIEKERWKNTIMEALQYYMEND